MSPKVTGWSPRDLEKKNFILSSGYFCRNEWEAGEMAGKEVEEKGYFFILYKPSLLFTSIIFKF